MESIFLKLLNLSIMASWLVVIALIFRVVLRRAPKYLRCVMWGLVALRLVIPFTVESPVGLVPDVTVVPSQTVRYDAADEDPELPVDAPDLTETKQGDVSYVAPETVNTDDLTADREAARETGSAEISEETLDRWRLAVRIASIVWAAGFVLIMIYAAAGYKRMKRKTRESILMRDNVYICDNVPTPFISGVVKPRIFLPSYISREDTVPVIAHEKAHIRRLDHLWKPLGFILLAVYWFNPLMWAAYAAFCRDVEFACDESVLREAHDAQAKRSYSFALLNCSAPGRAFLPCPLGFAEVSVKERVKDVLHYKKPTVWIITASVVAIFAAAACLLTSPLRNAESLLFERRTDYDDFRFMFGEVYEWDETVYSADIPENLFNAESFYDLSRADILLSEGKMFFRNYTAGEKVFTDWNAVGDFFNYTGRPTLETIRGMFASPPSFDGIPEETVYSEVYESFGHNNIHDNWQENDCCYEFVSIRTIKGVPYAFIGCDHRDSLPIVYCVTRLKAIELPPVKFVSSDIDGDGKADMFHMTEGEIDGRKAQRIDVFLASGNIFVNYYFMEESGLSFSKYDFQDRVFMYSGESPGNYDLFFNLSYEDGHLNFYGHDRDYSEVYYFGYTKDELDGDPVARIFRRKYYDGVEYGKDVFYETESSEYCLPIKVSDQCAVTTTDGRKYSLPDALNKGVITLDRALRYVNDYWVISKDTKEYSRFLGGKQVFSSAEGYENDGGVTEMHENYNTYGYTTFDVDGDGVTEYVALGYGPGKTYDMPLDEFLFTVTVSVGDQVKYREIFSIGEKKPIAMRLEEDGRPYVYTYERLSGDRREVLQKMDLSVEDGRIILRTNGKKVDYFDGLWAY